MNKPNEHFAVPDIQALPDSRNIIIDRVGVRSVRHPFNFMDRSQKTMPTVGVFDMYVRLEAEQKGTHMSRFIEILNNLDDKKAITVANFSQLVTHTAERLETAGSQIAVSFPFFKAKAAPVSGIVSLMEYDVKLVGVLEPTTQTAVTILKVVIPVTSLCPCSKEISDYGAHNQRSHITLSCRLRQDLWVEDLIDIGEEAGSAQLYGILKRQDEKFVTEFAYDHPKFVEDIVRDLALKMEQHPHIDTYQIESENFESIHNHSAYAAISKGRLYPL